jgi:hypothetical protein
MSAGGQREDPVQTARQLMADRRYNDAILVLIDVMKKSPHRFEEAEKLLTEVRKVRDTYNSYYEELIQVLNPPAGEEIDENRAYDLIRRMEDLDEEPNKAAVAAFSEMRRSIVFAVNDREFRDILAQAEEDLAREDYAGAVTTYLSALGIHEGLFLERGYDAQLVALSDELRSLLKQEGERFLGQRDEILLHYGDASAALSSENSQLLSQELEPLSGDMEDIAALRSSLLTVAENLDELRLEIQDESETDVPYLSTMRVIARGRSDRESPEGISGALFLFRKSLYDPLFSGAATVAEREYQNGVAAYREGSYDQSIQFFNSAQSWSANVQQLASFLPPEELPLQQEYLVASLQESTARYGELAELRRALVSEEDGWEQLEEQELIDRRERVLSLEAEGEETLQTLRAIISEIERRGSDGEGEANLDRPKALAGQVESAGEELLDLTLALERKSVETLYNGRLAGLEERFNFLEEETILAEGYVSGTQERIVEGGDPVEVRRPNRAIDVIEAAAPRYKVLDQELSQFSLALTEEPQRISSWEPVTLLVGRSDSIRTEIAELLSRGEELLVQAAELNRQADLALAEGDLRLNEADAQLASNNFEQARDKLQQAGEAFARSLTYREDPAVRARIDQEIPVLAERIITEQNRLIVRQVRQLINRGKERFFQENFIEAEQTFQRAQARWLQTNTEEEPEINNWLERVKRALETTSGVELAVDDPLYPEMTQMLNLARRDYQEARDLYQEGTEEEALPLFRQAEQKIEYVKEPFPNNKAASILYLQLLQYTQPEDFDTIFSSRFNTARRQISDLPEEAYRELKVLEAIRPDYPGMERAIYDAEIATGIRQPPIDRAKLARAQELYSEAEEIVAADVRAQFPVAITYLNEAIKLNPDFNAAIALKDRLQAGSGGAVRVVLSSVAQQQLKKAEDLFIDGRLFEAQVIVEQLLKNAENRTNPRLLELQKRIEALL